MVKRSPKELKADIERATQILELFTDPSQGRDVKMLIPSNVLANAHGIVFIRLYRVGLMLSAKSGSGIIIARLPDGRWSAPSGVSMSSLGFGHQAGGEIIDSIIVMNYRAAVKAFFDSGGQLQLGVGASIAAGPFGRAADVSAAASTERYIAATYAYSASKGLYLGYSFEGSKISERVHTNAAYYGRPIAAKEILTGMVPPVADAARLYDMLTRLGAGPRPGLPFSPKSSQTTKGQQFIQNQHQLQQQTSLSAAASASASTPTSAMPLAQNHQGFEEPPPPYTLEETELAVVVAKYDYRASQPGDISFQAGDHIVVTKRLESRDAWWEGEIGDKKGYFPANYTQDLD
ncbi:hypothetical protein BDF20DRAFT_981686 [Mycotypha africana]|uniref:uncharacterized protein n=1 Tax=Mycotypha africana TaxID=64632 RepID=UPI0022FFF88E|nr:uncharacterized protein BDF20DRAFT_981686 [Mycotypha africana]KAI8968488.1 hypothetical protein BDF20DRAFT_981686 [Mycotypha africana]